MICEVSGSHPYHPKYKYKSKFKYIYKITIGNDQCGVRLPCLPSQIQIQIQIQIYLQDYHRKQPMWSQAAIPPIPNTPTKLTWEVSGCQFCFSPDHTIFLSLKIFN